MPRFDWDESKNSGSKRTHRDSFEGAGKMGAMRKRKDFAKGRKNPYARRLKKQITIRLDEVPYQTLINLFLRDCARGKKRLSMKWEPA